MIKNFNTYCDIFSFVAIACGDKNQQKIEHFGAASPQVKTGVAPVADNEIALIERRKAYGTIKIEALFKYRAQMASV